MVIDAINRTLAQKKDRVIGALDTLFEGGKEKIIGIDSVFLRCSV